MEQLRLRTLLAGSVSLPSSKPDYSVKFVPTPGLHGTRRKRRVPYLKR